MTPIQCQQESPIWAVVKKESLFCAKQLNCATAPCEAAALRCSTAAWAPWARPSAATQLCPAPPPLHVSPSVLRCSDLPRSALLLGDTTGVSVRAPPGILDLSLRGKGERVPTARGELAYKDRRPRPWSWQFDCFRRHRSDRSGWSCPRWSVLGPQRPGKGPVLVTEVDSRNSP